jgi:formylglycine-generating enzyme required for sulfatase activity
MVVLVSATGDKDEKSTDTRITLAVAPTKIISEDQLDKPMATALAALLIDEMSKSTVFKVIDLEMSDQVEKLLAFANSDKCDQTQCHLAVGNIIPAQKLLVGTLIRLGDTYVLNVRMIDIEKNVVEFSAKEQMTGKRDDLMQLTQLVAIDLREHFGEKVERPVLASQPQMTPAPQPALAQPSIKAKDAPMVSVPAGEFMMGCNEQVDKKCQSNEKPYHKVYLDAFYIDKFLITQAEYNECVSSGKCRANKKFDGFSGDRQPVVGVTWDDANTYCQWAGKRLPTEAEWEKAARGTDGRIYPWGNSIDTTHANYSDSKIKKTTDVGNYPSGASPYGALDMAGNVLEWVSDWFDGSYYQNSPSKNPKGPDSGKYHVLRGGCFSPYIGTPRTSGRTTLPPNDPNQLTNGGGFRCARDSQ